MVRDETVTLNGLRFHYRDWGDPSAPPLVMLHGFMGTARDWDTLAQGMVDRYRVLALDQRGHGESEWSDDYHEQRLVEDLAGFVDHLGVTTFAAIGFSFGGTTVGSYAACQPGRVERVVLVDCFGADDNPALRVQLRTLRALPETFASPEEAVTAFRSLARHAPEDELRHWMISALVPGDDGRWSWRYDPVFRVPRPPGRLNAEPDVFTERLAGVSCPTLLVVGAESFLLDSAERMAAALPHTRLERLPKAGHIAPLDNPGGFLEIVDRFLTAAG
jgi:pimeloyl-ACP methyl ester carboxylesterase